MTPGTGQIRPAHTAPLLEAEGDIESPAQPGAVQSERAKARLCTA